tara:strand:- start:100 stop:1203 length:1104 start_codon:yes stop_codon:yes gene_type:complete
MANSLTNLRELSVGIGFLFGNEIFSFSPNQFYNECQKNIKGCELLSINDISCNMHFDSQENLIIKNGYQLSQLIAKKINTKSNNIIWKGNDIQSGNSIDLIIGENHFSLKENSKIIENMGLYKLLNILGETEMYKRGRVNAFEDFAKDGLNNWFDVTKILVINSLKKNDFYYKGNNYTSSSKINGNELYLNHNEDIKILKNFSQMNYDDFKTNTSSKIREKVFSKIIEERISQNEQYIDAKFKCADEAGKNIFKVIKQSIGKSPSALKRFFRIENFKYFFAKSFKKELILLKVPDTKEFSKNIVVKDINISIPKSQLNILTTIQNIRTGKCIIFENQIRYSHGQLNGSPEAKSYLKSGDISIVYDEV